MSPNERGSRATWSRCLYFAIAWIFASGFCILFVDRAASSWSYAHLHRKAVFVGLTHIIDPFQTAAALGIAIIGIRAIASPWRPSGCWLTAMQASLTVIVSVAIKDQLKFLFGRTWPETWVDHNPSWITNHSYGFSFFHGGAGWGSFPSGHTTETWAFVAVFWVRAPRLRLLWAALALLVPIGLFGADFHFVGDMVAGAFLGIAT